MVKKFIKSNDNFLWTGAVIGLVVMFLYLGGVREGFQTTPTVQTAMPTVMPSKASDTAPPMPPMNTTNFTPPPPSVMQNAKPSIATVRSKLNELKTMVDNM